MPLWLFWTIAGVLFLTAIGLLYRGLWGDRAKGRLRCPKCWYDMTGSFEAGKLVCPECGKDAGVEKRLRKNRRRRWAMLLAMELLIPHLFGLYIWYEWQRENDVAMAIEKAYAEVTWESIAPDTVLRWMPKPLHHYSNRVTEVFCHSDTVLGQVETLTRLQVLDLNSGNVTDKGMPHLQGMPQLLVLSFWNTQVTDAGLVHLEGLTQMYQLDLTSTNVTDAGLLHLKDMTQLRSLNLTETQVTDGGLVHLKRFALLQVLHLSSTKVTDAGLVHLKDMKQLKWVVLADTQVTPEGVAELQKALPECYIDF